MLHMWAAVDVVFVNPVDTETKWILLYTILTIQKCKMEHEKKVKRQRDRNMKKKCYYFQLKHHFMEQQRPPTDR